MENGANDRRLRTSCGIILPLTLHNYVGTSVQFCFSVVGDQKLKCELNLMRTRTSVCHDEV